MRMENPEALLDDLNEFTVRPPEEIPRPLENLLVHIAHTGDIVFPWIKLLPLIKLKLCAVLDQFHNSFPADEIAVIPNVPIFKYDVMRKRLIDYMDTFTSAPFTIQRICELITEPRRHYKRTDKFMRALEKTMLVVTTIEPHRNGNEGRHSPLMNGIVERSSSSSSSSPSSPQSTDSNEKTSSESDPEQMQPTSQANLEGSDDFANTSTSTSDEEKSSIKSGNLNEEYDETSSSLSVDLADETDSLLADHLLTTQSILVTNSATPMQISTHPPLTTPTDHVIQSEDSSTDINANASSASVIKTWDDCARTNVSSVDNVSSSDNPRVESPMGKALGDNNAATSSTDVSVHDSSTSYPHVAYTQHDTSATSTFSATGVSPSQPSNQSAHMMRMDGDASSSSDKDTANQDTIQTGEDSMATFDDKQIPVDGNVLMQEHTPDNSNVVSADQTPVNVNQTEELTSDNGNEEHIDVLSMSEADATDEMQVPNERTLDEVQITNNSNVGSEAETSDSSEALATDGDAEAQALDEQTSGDMQVVDNVTSAEVEGVDNVTSGENRTADVSSGEQNISVVETIDQSQGSEAETTGAEDERTSTSPEIEPGDNMNSEVETTDRSRFVEAETSENEGARKVVHLADNTCSEAQSTDSTEQEDSSQFVDSPCSEVSGSDEQTSYLQGPEGLPSADPVSQSDENVSNVIYAQDAGEASQSSAVSQEGAGEASQSSTVSPQGVGEASQSSAVRVSLQPPRPQDMDGEASQSSSVELSPAAADQTPYPINSLDEPSQSYHEDMEVEESHPNQKSPDDDVSSSETVSNNASCNVDQGDSTTGVGSDEDSMVVDVAMDKAGGKEADSTDNQQPMEET